MNNERTFLPFGKKMRVMNFTLLKYGKSLRGDEVKALRKQQGIPEEVQKHLKRGVLPYIKVETLSGDWSCEWICSSTIYNYIDSRKFENKDGKFVLTEDTVKALHNLFVLMYADCTVFGDKEYQEAKARALEAYMERVGKMKPVTDEENQKELDALKAEEQAKENLAEMAKEAAKEGGDDE